jgi:biotin carboxyl carrier protein
MRHLKLILREEGKPPEEISVELDGPRYVFSRVGATGIAEATRLPDGRLSLIFENGRQICGRVRPGGDGEVVVSTEAGHRRIAVAEPLRDRIAHAAGSGADTGDEEVRALMPGRVVQVAVAAGDRVPPGALLLVLEAMKMQNEIRTLRGGTVLRVDVEPGKTVEGGAPLAVVRSEDPREVSGSAAPGGPSQSID